MNFVRSLVLFILPHLSLLKKGFRGISRSLNVKFSDNRCVIYCPNTLSQYRRTICLSWGICRYPSVLLGIRHCNRPTVKLMPKRENRCVMFVVVNGSHRSLKIKTIKIQRLFIFLVVVISCGWSYYFMKPGHLKFLFFLYLT